jgi:enoyl-CoA hydratase/carnithine racemase
VDTAARASDRPRLNVRVLDTGTDEVLGHIEARVGALTLNRPDARNALTLEMKDALLRCIPALGADPEIGCVLLTGAGSAFCAGGDTKRMARDGKLASPEERVAQLHREHGIPLALHRLEEPTLAALPGPAAGAGFALALACDLRIAAESTFVTTAYARLGLSGDYGTSRFLTRLVGTARARELLFSAERRAGPREPRGPRRRAREGRARVGQADRCGAADRAPLHEGQPEPRLERAARSRPRPRGRAHGRGRADRGLSRSRGRLRREARAGLQRELEVMGSDPITLEYDGPVAILSNNRPDRHNAANNEMDARLWELLAELHQKEGPRCVVWRGNGKSFSSGRDTSELGVRTEDITDLEFIERGHAGTQLFFTLPCPILAALKGWVIGGSFERALLCDLRIAGESARMRLPEVLHGVVSRVVPDEKLDETALEIAHQIAKAPAFTVKMFRRTLGRMANPPVQRSIGEEAVTQSMVFASCDYAEMKAARAESRELKPRRR